MPMTPQHEESGTSGYSPDRLDTNLQGSPHATPQHEDIITP
jgi:hypothetical protein